MTRWWHEQTRRFWWKEAREAGVFVGLAWVVIIFLMIGLGIPKGADAHARYLWGSEFHSGATAILLFIAICIGVTAYAVEEEYETITPLLAKPIPLNDIFATKLGVRLGLLFGSTVLLGVIELWTGAWPIIWKIPSPIMFERWLGGLMLCVMGLGLGLYFGKTLGRQTSALVASAMVFMIGFVYLTMSPLAFVFEGPNIPEGPNHYWIRDILLPGLTGTIAIIAALFAPIGEPGFLARRKSAVGAISITLYAIILWSLTVVPPGDSWRRPEKYRQHLVARIGNPAAGLNVLVESYIDDGDPELADNPDALAVKMLKDVVFRNISTDFQYYTDFYRARGTTLLGLPVGRTIDTGERLRTVASYTDIERALLKHHNADWIADSLERVREPGWSVLHRMAALHLAGVENDPDQTEIIASFLADDSEFVQLMAALMLFSRDDQRGNDTLLRILTSGRHDDLLSYFAARTWTWNIKLGETYGELMRTWVVSDQYNGHRRAGRLWLQTYGSVADSDLIRRSLWIDRRNMYRGPGARDSSPDDMIILPYLKSWGAEDYIDQLWSITRERIAEMQSLIPVIDRIPEATRNSRTRRSHLSDADRRALSRWNTVRTDSDSYLRNLIVEGEEEAVELWQRIRIQLAEGVRNTLYRYYGDSIISELPNLGDRGFQLLQEMAADRQETVRARFQASLMLAYYGYEEYHDEVFRLLDTYRLYRDFFHGSSLRGAAEIMVSQGHIQYAGIIIDNWWNAYQVDRQMLDPYGGRSYRAIEAMEAAAGKKYGWDIRAWHRWWEREGMHIAATVK